MKKLVSSLIFLFLGIQVQAAGTQYTLDVRAKFPILAACGERPSQIILGLGGTPSSAVVPLAIHIQVCAVIKGLVSREGTIKEFPAQQIFTMPLGSSQIVRLTATDQSALEALMKSELSPDIKVTHSATPLGDGFKLEIESTDGSRQASLQIILSGAVSNQWPIKAFAGQIDGFALDARTSRVSSM